MVVAALILAFHNLQVLYFVTSIMLLECSSFVCNLNQQHLKRSLVFINDIVNKCFWEEKSKQSLCYRSAFIKPISGRQQHAFPLFCLHL